MSISDARLRANINNATHSAGPVTEEGKTLSKLNATTHGLTAQPEHQTDDEAELVAQRKADWQDLYHFTNAQQRWKFEQMVVAAIRIQRCQAELRHQKQYAAARAASCWNLDHSAEVEQLATRLKHDPALVCQRLKQSKHGVEWLKYRWEMLQFALERDGQWTDAQLDLAVNLLGVAPEFREFERSQLQGGSPQALAFMVKEEIDGLSRLLETTLIKLDRFQQGMASAKMPVSESPPVRLLRRYEAAQTRLYKAYEADLRPCEVAQVAPSAPPPTPPPPAPPEPPMTPRPLTERVSVPDAPPIEPSSAASPPSQNEPTCQNGSLTRSGPSNGSNGPPRGVPPGH